MSNTNNNQDTNIIAFKSNMPLLSIGTLTFGLNLKEETNLPFTKDLNYIPISNSEDYRSHSLITPSSDINSLTHESYISTILYLLVEIIPFKNKICSLTYIQDDSKAQLLYELKLCFNHYDNTKSIDSINLQCLLSKLFKPQGKFILTDPGNPLDVYFILVNSIHNYSIQAYPSDISNQKCKQCFVHKYFYLDMHKREKCNCGYQNNLNYPYLTYLLNIPIDKIIQLGKSSNLIQMGKTNKFNSFNFTFEPNQHHPNNDIDLYEKIKGKLFFYFSTLISDEDNKKICKNCNKNYIKKTLFINNLPSVLSFNLSNNNLFSFELNIILASYVLIPPIFEINQLFDNNHPNKAFYEFFAVVMVKKAKNYSIAIKCDDASWYYFGIDNINLQCSSWSEVIDECLKNQCSPIMILYRIQEKYSNKEKVLDIEDIKRYIKYINSIEQYKNDNPFRTNESVIPIETIIKTSYNESLINNPNSNVSNVRDNIKLRTNSSASNIKSSSSLNKKKNNNENKGKKKEVIYYNCIFCGGKNRIENQYCLMCKKCNNDIVNKVKHQYQQKETQLSPQQYQYNKKNDHGSSDIKNKREFIKQNLFNKPSLSSNSQTNHQIFIKDNKRSIDQIFDSGNNQLSANRENDPIVLVYQNPNQNQNEYQHIQKNSNTTSREISQENMITDNKIKYQKQIKRILYNPEWKCDICYHYNNPSVYRCGSCKTINPFQRDLLQGININRDNNNELFKPNHQQCQKQKKQRKYSSNYSNNQLEKNSSFKNSFNKNNNFQQGQVQSRGKETSHGQYGYSTKLNKRQMSLGNINQKPFDLDRDKDIVFELDIAKQKANSIQPKRPSSSNKMILSNAKAKSNMMNPPKNYYYNKGNNIMQKNINEFIIRPKTSIPKHTKNPFT